MPLEEINPYTPQLYRSLGTPVTLDLNLGSTGADIAKTRDGVAALPEVVTDAVRPIGQRLDSMKVDLARAVEKAVSELRGQAAENLATVLMAIGPPAAPEPAPVPMPPTVAITDRSALFVRALTQVLTQGIDKAPGQPDKQNKPEWGENVQLERELTATRDRAEQDLAASPDLLARYLNAFARFQTRDTPERHRRYAEVHALIPEITRHLG